MNDPFNLRILTLRAMGQLHANLMRPLRSIEIYNHRNVRGYTGVQIENELMACCKDKLVTKNPSGEYDLTAMGREWLQSKAGEPAASAPDADIPVFVQKKRGPKPGTKHKPKDPDRLPGPVHHIPVSEQARVESVTAQLRAAAPQDPNHHVGLTLADLEQRLMQHEQAADELRELISSIKDIFKVKT